VTCDPNKKGKPDFKLKDNDHIDTICSYEYEASHMAGCALDLSVVLGL